MDNGAIAGGIVSGIVVISVFISGLLFFVRLRRGRSKVSTRLPAVSSMTIELSDISTPSNSDPPGQSFAALAPHLATNMHDTLLAARTAPFFIPQVRGLYEKQVRHGQRSRERRNTPTSFIESADENQDRRGSVPSAGTSSVLPPVNDPDLRRELEDLRREVERMRQEREGEVVDEAPPIYDYELENAMRR